MVYACEWRYANSEMDLATPDRRPYQGRGQQDGGSGGPWDEPSRGNDDMRVKERQKQTAFLRQCLVYHDTPASRKLAESMAHIEQGERSLRRAVWMVVRLAGLAVAGIAYSALLMDNYPDGTSGSVAHFVIKAALGWAWAR